jgi:hypothetical protein
MVLLTTGYALFQTGNNSAVMAEAGPERRGLVSGMLNLSRNLGLITGASAMGAVFARASAAVDVTTAEPAAIAAGTRATFAAAALLVLAGIMTMILSAGGRARRGPSPAPQAE